MDSEITTRLVDLFWEGLRNYSSEEWFAAGSSEKEEILWHALEILDEPIDKEIALDIFWQWADGLEEDSFIDFSGLTENLGAYDVRREGKSLVAYLDGIPIIRSQNYDELLADIREFEKEAKEVKATPTFLVSWIIEARTPSGYIRDSKEVQANTANEAIAIIKKQFPRARQLSATLVESASFAEEFEEYSSMWNAEDKSLAEALTPEEKVDAWHEGTRPVNYKAAKDDKLKKYLSIAKDRGYKEIIATIETELRARGTVVEEDEYEFYVDDDFYKRLYGITDDA